MICASQNINKKNYPLVKRDAPKRQRRKVHIFANQGPPPHRLDPGGSWQTNQPTPPYRTVPPRNSRGSLMIRAYEPFP